MDCRNKGTKRRRLESSMSNASAASTQTQATELSLDSNHSATQMKYSRSQTDIRHNRVVIPRQRTTSARPYSYASDLEEDGAVSPQNRAQFFLNQAPQRYGRRNTENSINTEDLSYIQPINAELHRSTTAPNVPVAQQNTQNYVSPTPGRVSTGSRPTTPLFRYDNNQNTQTFQRTAPSRSQSSINVEHDYMLIEPRVPPPPLDTVVHMNGQGGATQIIPNGRPFLNSERSGDSQDSSNSYGYCTNKIEMASSWCFYGHKLYQKAFVILIIFNITFLCAFGGVIAYFISNTKPPEQKLPNCFEYEQVQELIEDPGSSAIFSKDPSGLYCLDFVQVARRTRKEKCRPVMELKGVWKEEQGGKPAGFQWEGDRSCGLKVSDDKKHVEIHEPGKYFLYSRVHFHAKGEGSGQMFPVGHELYNNDRILEKIVQICRDNGYNLQHASVLETIQMLREGEKLSVRVGTGGQTYIKGGNTHRLGIIKL